MKRDRDHYRIHFFHLYDDLELDYAAILGVVVEDVFVDEVVAQYIVARVTELARGRHEA